MLDTREDSEVCKAYVFPPLSDSTFLERDTSDAKQASSFVCAVSVNISAVLPCFERTECQRPVLCARYGRLRVQPPLLRRFSSQYRLELRDLKYVTWMLALDATTQRACFLMKQALDSEAGKSIASLVLERATRVVSVYRSPQLSCKGYGH
jgi:hypothetical protein